MTKSGTILTNEERYVCDRRDMWFFMLGAAILLFAAPIMMYFLGMEMATYDRSALNADRNAGNTFIMVNFLCFCAIVGGCCLLFAAFKKRESWIELENRILSDRESRDALAVA